MLLTSPAPNAPMQAENPDDLQVGFFPVDEDHRALIESCDRLLSMVGRRLAWADLFVPLSELLASIEVHFTCEEQRFPGHYSLRDIHLKEHVCLAFIYDEYQNCLF